MQAIDSEHMAPSVSFYGMVNDHHDALLLITAARFGLVPRFRRRLNMTEQDALIYSGSVFLWTEEESCMKRWTDGYPWSPSRIHHEFLLYREMAERGCARSRTSSRLAASNDTNQGLKQNDDRRRKTIRVLAGSLFNYKELESLIGLSTSGPPRPDDVFKRGGLMKKTFSLSLPGETWHVVSYYTIEDALTSRLPVPKESQRLKGLHVSGDVHNYHALSLRRQSLGSPIQSSNETSPHHNTSSQVPLAYDLASEIVAAVSSPTNTDNWFHMFSTPVENLTSYPPPLSPVPYPYTNFRSGEDRRHIVPDDATATPWYNFT